MADRTLTINHADGGSETYTINRDKFAAVRNMIVDGAIVSIDHTEQPDVRTLLMDGETITIDTTREGVRTLTVDGVTITIDRTDELNIKSFIEQFTAPAVAYSLRDLASNAGNTRVVRVRRSSDNSEQDFTANQITNGDLVAFCGAGNGFVETWYDQSGNGNDATQATIASQPKIVDGGSLNLSQSGQAALNFDGTDDSLAMTNIDLSTGAFLAAQVVDVPSTSGVVLGSNSSRWLSLTNNTVYQTRNTNGSNIYLLSYNSALTSGNTYILSQHRESNLMSLAVNGTDQTDTEVLNGTDTFETSVIGRRSSANYWSENISEIIIYASDQSANRTAIETNINDHYNIY